MCCFWRSYPTGLVGCAVCSVLHQGKNRQKQAILKKILTVLDVFSVFYDTKNGKNKDIFYSWGLYGSPWWLSIWCGGGVHWCRWSGNSCYFADVSKIGQDTAGCSAFCPLSRFVLGALSSDMALFRVLRAFLARFGVVVGVCVVLVLCVACVAFVCVWS